MSFCIALLGLPTSLFSLALNSSLFTLVFHSCLPTGGKAYGQLKSEQERQLDEINQVCKVSVWHRVCLGFVSNFFVHGNYPSYLAHFCDQWYIIHMYMYIQLFLHVLTIASGYQVCIVVGGWMTHVLVITWRPRALTSYSTNIWYMGRAAM